VKKLSFMVLLCIILTVGCKTADNGDVKKGQDIDTVKIDDSGDKESKQDTSSETNQEINTDIDTIHEDAIKSVLKEYQQAINNQDMNGFKGLMSSSGVLVIRNFVSGNGSRGKNVSNVYTKDNIPEGFQFPVEDETSIELKSMFPEFLESDTGELAITKGNHLIFGQDSKDKDTNEPTASHIWEQTGNILSSVKENELKNMMIFSLGEKELVIGEAIEIEFNTGSWTIFEKEQDKYYLRVIIDFR